MNKTIVEAKNLCKFFKTGTVEQKVLENLNIEIKKGDFTVIMGSSGSGKSTLLYALSCMDKPTSGDILFMGEIVKHTDKNLAQLHRTGMGFVFQSSNLIQDLTSFENITIPAYQVNNKKTVNAYADEILEKFNLTGVKNKYPGEMSGGEQQRVAIARAVINKPEVIFADEPTGALNSKYSEEVLDYFNNINKEGITIVLVTHDVKACARGNRIIYLHDGKIDGELSLEPYNEGDQKEREKKIYEFLNVHNW